MNPAAVLLWGYAVSWPAVFAVWGAACAMLLSLSLWTLRGRSPLTLLPLFPAAALLGLVLGRLGHWYCHPFQYASFPEAMTDYLRGGFSLWGCFAGVLLAAGLYSRTGLTPGLWALLDDLAPGAALGIAVGRLGSLYDISDRGKLLVRDPRFWRLPYAVYTVLSPGEGQWRFATFFWQSLGCLVLALGLLLLRLLYRRRRQRGTTALFFVLLYAAGQILLDSTRYDADFFRFNGFIHVPQLLSALGAAGALGALGARSVRRFGYRRAHGALFALGGLCLALCGVLEYGIQRYAGHALPLYGAMGALLGAFCGIGAVFQLWRPGKKPSASTKKRPPARGKA